MPVEDRGDEGAVGAPSTSPPPPTRTVCSGSVGPTGSSPGSSTGPAPSSPVSSPGRPQASPQVARPGGAGPRRSRDAEGPWSGGRSSATNCPASDEGDPGDLDERADRGGDRRADGGDALPRRRDRPRRRGGLPVAGRGRLAGDDVRAVRGGGDEGRHGPHRPRDRAGRPRRAD